jgi:hypothetical protein
MARFRQIALINPTGFLFWNRFSLLGHQLIAIGWKVANALLASRLSKGRRAKYNFNANPGLEIG